MHTNLADLFPAENHPSKILEKPKHFHTSKIDI